MDFSGRTDIDDVLRLSQLRAFVKDEVLDVLNQQGVKRKIFMEKRLVSAMEATLETRGAGFVKMVRESADLYLCSDELAQEAAAHQTSPAAAGSASSSERWVYILRSSLAGLKNLAERIRLDVRSRESAGNLGSGFFRKKPEIDIYFTPRKFCRSVLEEAFQGGAISKLGHGGIGDATVEVFGHRLTVHSLELDLIPLEPDLITMDMPDFVRETMLQSDVSSLAFVARSLIKIQAFYGDFKAVRGKGRLSEKVNQILKRMRLESSKVQSASTQHPSQVDCLYIFDRDLDPLTPVLHHLTYEGLVNEIFGLPNQYFGDDKDIEQDAQADIFVDGAKGHVFTAEADIVYRELRGSTKAQLGTDMQSLLYSIETKRDERKSLKELRDIRIFMEKVPMIKEAERLIGVHIAIAKELKKVYDSPDHQALYENQRRLLGINEENVMLDSASTRYLDNCIFQNHPLPKVLRVLCATALTEGLTKKNYDELRQKFTTAYGLRALSMIENLERAGFLGVGKRSLISMPTSKALRTKGADVVSQLQFWKDRPAEDAHRKFDRSDPSRFYDGYKPPLVRLAETAMTGPMQWYRFFM